MFFDQNTFALAVFDLFSVAAIRLLGAKRPCIPYVGFQAQFYKLVRVSSVFAYLLHIQYVPSALGQVSVRSSVQRPPRAG